MKKLIILVMLSTKIMAQDLPSQDALNSDQVVSNVSDNTRSSFIPKDRVLSNIVIEQKVPELQALTEKDLEENIKKSQELFKTIFSNTENKDIKDNVTIKANAPKRTVIKSLPPAPVAEIEVESGIFVLNTPIIVHDFYNSITLPSGSTALATLMAGVEVSTEIRQVDARLDYAFLGPNGSVVELKGCHIWLDVSGNYNTERIYGEGKSISCRTQKGSTFEIPVFAQLRDYKDEYIGKKAELITRGKVAAAALGFLQSGVTEFGKAMAAAQVSTDVVAGGPNSNPQSVSNVTGSDARYITGKSLAGASAGFLDWWIDYYKILSPTLAMPPGSKIFLTIKGEVQIPKEFFTEEKINANEILRKNTASTLSVQGEGDEKN